MTKKAQELFNLTPMEELQDDISDDEMEVETSENTELEQTPKRNVLENIKEDQHDKEADDVRNKAIQAFEDIMEVGRNVNPERSARLFEVAGQFLRTGLDASNSKAEKQLKAAKLKIEAVKLKVSDEMVEQLSSGNEVMADRNELLKQMMVEGKKETIDVTVQDETQE